MGNFFHWRMKCLAVSFVFLLLFSCAFEFIEWFLEAFFQSPNNDGFQKASAITILVQHEPLIIYSAFHMVMYMSFDFVILILDIELFYFTWITHLGQLVTTHQAMQWLKWMSFIACSNVIATNKLDVLDASWHSYVIKSIEQKEGVKRQNK